MSVATHQGRDVLQTRIEVRNIAGGLNDGLAVDPVIMPIGTRFTLAVDCVVTGDSYKAIKDTDGLTYAMIAKGLTGVIIDRAIVQKELAAQQAKIDQFKGHEPIIDGNGEPTKSGKQAKPMGNRAIGDLGAKPAARSRRRTGEPAKVGPGAVKAAGAAKARAAKKTAKRA